jgi:8-oxo-dGTP diphosphatase
LEAAQWLPVDKTKILAMDHNDIVRGARQSLLKELPYSPIASNLLPSKFTLPELHALIEGILGRPIDRPNFRRKILKSDLIVKVGQDGSGKHRPADAYTFRHGKKTSLTEEFKFGF